MTTEPATPESPEHPIPPEVPTSAQMAERLQARLATLTERCHQAEAEAKMLSEKVKGVQAIRKDFAKIAGLSDPRIIAMARTAYETSLELEREILGMEGGIHYGLELRREMFEAWAHAWLSCETITANPADEWYEAMAGDRDRFRAWREAALERMRQGERRWLSEGTEPKRERPPTQP